MALSGIFTRERLRLIKKIVFFGILFAGIALILYTLYLGVAAKIRFAGKKWELPARIYARPLEIYPGMTLKPEMLAQELDLMRYRRVGRLDAPGSYSRFKDIFTLHTRPFRFEDGDEPARKIRITFRNGKISALKEMTSGAAPGLVRIDPALIGSFYPTHNEDRLWVKFKDISPLIKQAVLAIEDRDFYTHHGVKPTAILRALIVNLREGRTVQGGSTLTQQLVKNLFLTHQQTLRRKFDEAIMALSLELFYEKDRIFEAYLNEVYMGQDGKRAIHGFGMASRFYFNRSLTDLRSHEIALLVGLLKGPSTYDPRRFPERALQRRNLVLKVMKAEGLLRSDEAEKAMRSRLGAVSDPPSGTTKFPAFLDLVRRNLLIEYKEEDLRTEGLRIFTAFDPRIQLAVEKSVAARLASLESQRKLASGKLEAAAIVTSPGGNEVLALAGARKPGAYGFNRALDARRPIGSLIKPAVYLTALQYPEQYNLITPLDDSVIRVKGGKDGGDWVPQNYDRRYHGLVPLYSALAHSYNVATVRLGMEMGLENVFATLHQLGVEREFAPYPSALLGTVPMSVTEVAQMYQTLASGGFYSPIRAIHAVYQPDGTPLQRYPLSVRENVEPGAVYLLGKALQAVVAEGTGRALQNMLPRNMGVAGKTGTSNDLRDSWFAGFTGDHLAVVWVGRDDNKPCGLTGASGALRVWGDFMSRIPNAPLRVSQPENIRWVIVDPDTGYQTDESCPGAISIPFIAGSEPKEAVACDSAGRMYRKQPTPGVQKKQNENLLDWLKDLF
ncbi:penicillin-binding protein 1B [Desulfonema ishimotonii]|uniref:Penicillin-binding protein 1B n=1 Tax=Desulfonema ishimotonii TaxID=45657 RepID=A0A401FWY6_9BACT|nr:penicillin-binding protein 1B [Desulfonema ishimotonii]GBC61512.1 penicillin-binding protein 1B [Desulfonema ishimotonii]